MDHCSFLYALPLWSQSSSINLFGGDPETPKTGSKSKVPSPMEPPTSGSSVAKTDRSGDEPALKIGMKYIQHSKMRETQSQSIEVASNDTPNLLLPPTNQTSKKVNPSGDITISQALFDGYISFLKMGRQFGALDFEIPMRQLKSEYGERTSGLGFLWAFPLALSQVKEEWDLLELVGSIFKSTLQFLKT